MLRAAESRGYGGGEERTKKRDYDNFLKRGIMITAAILSFSPSTLTVIISGKPLSFCGFCQLRFPSSMPWSQNQVHLNAPAELWELCENAMFQCLLGDISRV